MLTRQAISPVRAHLALVAAIVLACVCFVAIVITSASRLGEVHTSPAYSFSGISGTSPSSDFGYVTATVDSAPLASTTPAFINLVHADLGVNDGQDRSHQVHVDYDDPDTAWSDSVTVATPREVVLDGNDWICERESDLREDGWHVRVRCKRGDDGR